MQRNRVLAWTTIAVLTVVTAHTAAAQDSSDKQPMGDGPAPMADHTQHSGDYVELAPGGVGSATVTCPSGSQPTGGGYRTTAFDIYVTDSAADGFGWTVTGKNIGSEPQSLRATVICTVP